MLPWVRPRDIVVVRRTVADAVRCGDLVLFARNGQLFLHRMIDKERSAAGSLQLLVKGDAHPHPDVPVSQDEFFGRVVRIHRGKHGVELDSPWQLVRGVLIARISARSARWYPLARFAARVVLSIRKFFADLRAAAAESL